MASLGDLPSELLADILSELEGPDDIKSFRLTCRGCASAAVPVLFGRIRVSRLRKDWDAFEQIATRPHLAQHVRELVWYELHLESWTGESQLLDADKNSGISDSYDVMRQLLSDAASDPDVFVIPTLAASPDPDEYDEEQVIRAVPNEHRVRFFELLDLMPNLTSFISWPMPYDREVPYNGYPISLDLFGLNLDRKFPGGNMGFLAFLLPALEQPKSTIVNLRLAEEMISHRTFLRPSCIALVHHLEAFGSLTSLDLHLNYFINEHCMKEGTQDLNTCLKAAGQLRHLGLHLEASTSAMWDSTSHSFGSHTCHSHELRHSHMILEALVEVRIPQPSNLVKREHLERC